MIGGAFVDLFMTKGHMREPHWHPNAWELMLLYQEKQLYLS